MDKKEMSKGCIEEFLEKTTDLDVNDDAWDLCDVVPFYHEGFYQLIDSMFGNLMLTRNLLLTLGLEGFVIMGEFVAHPDHWEWIPAETYWEYVEEDYGRDWKNDDGSPRRIVSGYDSGIQTLDRRAYRAGQKRKLWS